MVPDLLIDPEGEGVYLHAEGHFLHFRAARLLLGDAREWRNVTAELVYMRPGDDDHWMPASIGRHPRGWRLNLPKRWRPVPFLYFRPKE